MKLPVIFLMGPTASGKTDLAIALHARLPIDVISVDSALVYREMNIGTAKPSPETLQAVPHRLIDIRDPADSYSVAEFCRDAEREIIAIHQAGRIPLLVGGGMMYFKALLSGLADMPAADERIRQEIEAEAEQQGWPYMHQQLMTIDSDYAASLHPNHSQRIARGLEVYRSSGLTMTELRAKQDASRQLSNRYRVIQLALVHKCRATLHERIQRRFIMMLEQGLVDEVRTLRQRSDLTLALPSMRSVGYRQVWQYLDGQERIAEPMDEQQLLAKGVAATRQLAKRQLTWLKSWQDLHAIHPELNDSEKNIELVLNFISAKSL